MSFGRWKILSSRRLSFAGAFCAAIVGTFALPCFGQQSSDQSPPSKPGTGTPRLKSHDSITVTATYTPEEKEDSKINAIYDPINALQYRKGDCDTAIERYKTELIPLAEKSPFEKPKNKFLYLAYRGIASCYMKQLQYEQAEQTYQKVMDYLPIWPGLDDSDYPVVLRLIAGAQMGQEHWQAAETLLEKSLSVFDLQIDKALKSDKEFVRTEAAEDLKQFKVKTLIYLAVTYTREGRMPEALDAADKAYDQATQANEAPDDLNQIVKTGIEIALISKDQDAMTRWSRRVPDQK